MKKIFLDFILKIFFIGHLIEEGRAASKSLIKNLAIFFLCPSKQLLPISFQIQLLEYCNNRRNKGKSSQGTDKLF
jgi:hypothetical protein